jgi:hypothetical protein
LTTKFGSEEVTVVLTVRVGRERKGISIFPKLLLYYPESRSADLGLSLQRWGNLSDQIVPGEQIRVPPGRDVIRWH